MNKTRFFLTLAIFFFIFNIFNTPVSFAANADESAIKNAYNRYISSYNRYLDALKNDLDEKTLEKYAERYLDDMKKYKKLLAGDDAEALAAADSIETEIKALRASSGAVTAAGAYNGALSGEAKKQYAIAKVNEMKKNLSDFASLYAKKAEASRKKYKQTSWFSPISKIKAAYGLLRDKFSANKAESTMEYYSTPRTDGSKTSFFKEIATEFGHVTNISKLLYDTNLDAQSFIFSDPAAEKDVLVVYTMPSPHGINWASPKGLALAGGLNQLTTFHTDAKHPIGHVFMSLKTQDTPETIIAGMTTFDNTEEVELVMKHGYCLGVLFADLRGKFDDGGELMRQITERHGTGRVSYMKFLLSPSMGKRLLQYFREYKEKKCDEHYGGANRPRYAEGGGCSPFGVSFIEVAGFLLPEYEKEWKVTLEVPKRLCGGPAFKKRVSFKSLISAGAWAKPGEDSAQLEMWDPTLMFRWMVNEWKKEFSAPTGKYILEKNKKTMSLVLDCRDIEASDGQIWLSGPNPYRQHGLRYGPDPYAYTGE